jgi:hypothetical protein
VDPIVREALGHDHDWLMQVEPLFAIFAR